MLFILISAQEKHKPDKFVHRTSLHTRVLIVIYSSKVLNVIVASVRHCVCICVSKVGVKRMTDAEQSSETERTQEHIFTTRQSASMNPR